jgi:hypothetical protein
MPQREQFVVNVDDDGHSFARLISTLRRARVALEAASVATDRDAQVARMIIMPLGAAKRALRKAGFQFSTQKVLALNVGLDLLQLTRIAAVLSDQAIPVEYVYWGIDGLVVLGTSDVKRASQLVRKAGIG